MPLHSAKAFSSFLVFDWKTTVKFAAGTNFLLIIMAAKTSGKFTRGVLWGRFNPPHNGHLQVMRFLLENECQELVVAIGSALASHSQRNPFTGGERLLMLKAMIEQAGLEKKVILVQVPDNSDSYVGTASNLRALCPPFDAIFTNRAVIRDIFEGWGVPVRGFPDFDSKKYSGTSVRSAMLSGKSWRELVPQAVYEFIAKNGLLGRLNTVQQDEYEKP